MHRSSLPWPRRVAFVLLGLVVFGSASVVASCSGPSVDADTPLDEPSVVPDDLAARAPEDASIPALVVDLAGEPVFDPTLVAPMMPAQLQILDLLYDGLTTWDAEAATWRQALATEVTESPDGTTWTFTLADDAAFSDGTPLTAVDVKRSLEAATADRAGLPALRLDLVDEIVVVDGQHVAIVLEHPDQNLPVVLSSPLFGVTPAGDLDGRVGSGPYVFRDASHLEPITDQTLPEIVLAALDADVAFAAPDSTGDRSSSVLVEVHFALNTRSPKLSDRSVRGLVQRAIRQDAFIEVFGGAAVPIDTLDPAGVTCAPSCSGEVQATTAELPELFVDYVIDDTGREAELAALVAQQLRFAGITASARPHTLEEFVDLVSAGGHEVYRTGWVGLAAEADGMLEPYLSGSADNVSGYSDDAFDELVRTARASGRAADYRSATEVLEADAVVIPLVRLTRQLVVSEGLNGVSLRPDGTFDVAGLVRR